MNTKKRIAVIGDGGWGTTLAILLSRKGYSVTLWGVFSDYVEMVKHRRENIKFLPGIKIPQEVAITASLEDALSERDIVILAVPSQFLRGVLTRLRMHDISGMSFVSAAKGIENGTLKRMSELIYDVLGKVRLSILTGPTIALEVANGVPTTAVVSSSDESFAREMQDLFRTDRFRVYTSSDMVGVETGGALKNIIAIAAGICDGLGFGTNAKAALLTRGLVEIVRLGTAVGARRETFYGLSGLGDLTTTCISPYSRNRWLGEEIGRGKKLNDILKETDMVIEGVATAKAGRDLAAKYKVEMPITSEIYKVLYEGKDPEAAVHELMTRAPKEEK